jgi:hypothetical protein
MAQTLPPRFLSTNSQYAAVYDEMANAITGVNASGVFQANIATWIPLHLPFAYPVKRVFWVNAGTVAGNVNVGLYTAQGKRFWLSGSTAMAGASQLQYVTPSPTFILPPGLYYIAFVADGNTGTHWRLPWQDGRRIGVLQQSSAFALPADTSGAAAWATGSYWLGGLTLTASGF